jgi:hypothetical protein
MILIKRVFQVALKQTTTQPTFTWIMLAICVSINVYQACMPIMSLDIAIHYALQQYLQITQQADVSSNALQLPICMGIKMFVIFHVR